ALLTTAANADTFNITFHPVATVIAMDGRMIDPIFTDGTIVTDGACSICSILQLSYDDITRSGIEYIRIPTGGITEYALGVDDLDIGGHVTLDTSTLSMSGEVDSENNFLILGGTGYPCPDGIVCPSGQDAYFYDASGVLNEWGTFTVTSAVPEPAGWVLL